MLTHKGTQTLKTSRLILRRFTSDDVQAVYNNWANDPAVTEFLRWPAHTNTDITRRVLDSWISDYEKNDYYQWAIVPDEFSEPIGCIGVVGQNDRISMVHIGYALGKAWWHRSYMSEALAAVIEFFFTQIGVNRIESQHDPNNPHSGGVMKKCGMKYEGTLRQADFSNKGIVDACMYSILREEFDINKEIAYYISLPCAFIDFIDVPGLTNGEITLVCIAKKLAIPEKKYVPSYDFAICKDNEKIGEINLRIGYSGFGPDLSSLYYGGQIGYSINEEYRGNGYAGEACKLVSRVAKVYGMTKLLITNDVNNTASRRVCEKLGLRYIRCAKLPEWIDLYKEGYRYVNIYEMNIE